MEHLKRHSFLILAIVLVIGVYIFLQSQKAVAPEEEIKVYGPETILSHEDLVAYAKSDFDKKEMMFKELIIGKHNDIEVKVTHPCSDVCPDATMRIIRYDIDPKLSQRCEMAGGEIKSILVPMAITVMAQPFCFPKPIVEAGIYEFAEPQT